MAYTVKEIFKTLQGEGGQAGRAAVFCRFSGCNLWSGRESDRAKAQCRFCDTDFVGTDGTAGGRYASASFLSDAVAAAWGDCRDHRFVVLTGGEPMLQVDTPLIDALHSEGFEIAIETNGTLPIPEGIDWVCVSPKAGTELKVRQGNELKIVYPQVGIDPALYSNLEFGRFSLSPMDSEFLKENIKLAIAYCLENPKWVLSTQTHKHLGIR
jgi:7-carboxy-7-deazaguanine synthase